MSGQIGIDRGRKDCPFPSKLCTNCPFYKTVPCSDCLRHGKECTDGSFKKQNLCPKYCAWKEKIKPTLQKDRIAHELVDRAFEIMRNDLAPDSLPLSEKEDEDGEEF